MALQWQLVNIPVDGGLNDKASPLLVDAPASAALLEAVFDKNGELIKRNGWTALSVSGTLHTIGANGHLLAAKASEGTSLYEQSQAAWSTLNRAVPVLQKPYITKPVTYSAELTTSMASNTNRAFVQAVEQNGYLITFTEVPVAITRPFFATTVNLETNDTVFNEDMISAFPALFGLNLYRTFKAVKHSTRYVSLVVTIGSPYDLKHYLYDTTTHTMIECATDIAAPAGELFDVCHGASVSVPPAVAYVNGSGGITVKTLQTDGEFSSSSVSFNSASYDRVAINTYNTGYVIAARVVTTNRMHFFEIDTSFSTLNSYTGSGFNIGSINQLSIIQSANGYGSIANSYIIAYCNVAALTTEPGTTFSLFEVKATSGVLSSAAFPPDSPDLGAFTPASAFLYSDLFWLGTSLCIYVVPDMNADQKALDGAVGIVISKTENHDSTRYNVVSKISAFDEVLQGPKMNDGQFILDRPSTGTSGSQGSKVYLNASKYNASAIIPTVYELAPFVSAGSHVRSTRYGSAIVFSGGCSTGVDPIAEFELSPVAPPFIMSAAPSGSGAAGSYFYRAVVEFTDANGLLHRSAPSNVVESQRGSTGATLTIKLFRVSGAGYYGRGPKVALYRTINGGSIFYRLASLTDTAADTDAVIANNEILYTDSGELETQSMFATDDILVTSKRMWAIPSDDKTSVWYTKEFQPGIFPEFSSALRLSIPAGGDNIALGQLDDKIVVFKKNSVFVIYGQGPNNLGQGGEYVYEQVQTNVGCIEPGTVVSYPDGVMFAHSSGLQSINRNLQVQPLGIPVDDTDPTTLCSAVAIPHKHQVRFGVRSSSVTLYYSYLYNRWSRLLTDQAASTLWTNLDYEEPNQLIYLTSGGAVRYEPSSDYVDNGGATGIDLYYTTPWIKLAGIQGTKRIRRALFLLRPLNGAVGDGSMSVSVFYNYVDTVAQTKTWNAPSLLLAPQKQPELTLSQQRLESVKFRVRIFADSGETKGRGYALAGITLDVGIKKGLYKQQAAALRV